MRNFTYREGAVSCQGGISTSVGRLVARYTPAGPSHHVFAPRGRKGPVAEARALSDRGTFQRQVPRISCAQFQRHSRSREHMTRGYQQRIGM